MDPGGDRRKSDQGLRREKGAGGGGIPEGVPAEEGAGRSVLRQWVAAWGETDAGVETREEQDAGVELSVCVGISGGRWNHGVPLLGDRVRVPQRERTPHQSGDRRWFSGAGATG